jgi:D-3-phosphoglycerate dehydrogenase
VTTVAAFRLLITDRFDLDALALLKGDHAVEVAQSGAPKPTPEELAQTEGLIIRSRTKIDRALLEQAPALKLIITATSGFDHIDLEATSERGLTVMFTPEANAASAAELTWALVLACARRVPEAHRAVKAGDWRREALLGRELAGKTYGVIGLGRIGTRVARFAQAFGMKVVAFDPYKDDSHFEKARASRMALDELLRLADFASLHVPATPETRHMLSSLHLQNANPGLILINTSRGSALHEPVLIEALEKNWIAGCGLDVFEKEPLSRQSALTSLSGVVLSPHIGATTGEAFAAASLEAAEKALRFAKAGLKSDCLPPMEEWYQQGFQKKSGRADEG